MEWGLFMMGTSQPCHNYLDPLIFDPTDSKTLPFRISEVRLGLARSTTRSILYLNTFAASGHSKQWEGGYCRQD